MKSLNVSASPLENEIMARLTSSFVNPNPKDETIFLSDAASTRVPVPALHFECDSGTLFLL